MARSKLDIRGDAFRRVLGFTFAHWKKQPIRVTVVGAGFLFDTLADVLTPLFAGQLVDAISQGVTNPAAWNAALVAFGLLMALGIGATIAIASAATIFSAVLSIDTNPKQCRIKAMQPRLSQLHAEDFAKLM